MTLTEDGQILNAPMAGDLVLTASEMPDIVVDHVAPKTSDLGAKGAGEAGTRCAPAAL